MNGSIAMEPIGYMKSVFTSKNGTPRQANITPVANGHITILKSVFTNPEHSLEGLSEFSHVWILFGFHANDNTHVRAKIKPPRLNGRKVGVFATRSPHRPNPVGLSLVKLDRVQGATLYLSGIDLIDGTPILDIKPYIPQYDSVTCYGDHRTTPNTVTNEKTGFDSKSHMTNSTLSQADSNAVISEPEINRDSVIHPDDDLHESCCAACSSTESLRLYQSKNSNFLSDSTGGNRCTGGQSRPTAEKTILSSLRTCFESGDASQGYVCFTTDPPGSPSNLQMQSANSQDILLPCDGVKLSSQDAFNRKEGSKQLLPQTNEIMSCWPSDRGEMVKLEDYGSGLVMDTNSSLALEQKILSNKPCVQEEGPGASQHRSSGSQHGSSGVTVPDWIESGRTCLCVTWTPRAEEQLRCVCSEDRSRCKTLIEDVLRNDPRSTYRMNKCDDRLYYFTVSHVHVTAWFDRTVVEVLRIQKH